MSELSDDIARGCLENGEPIEARWGTGEWSQQPEQRQEPDPWEEELAAAEQRGYERALETVRFKQLEFTNQPTMTIGERIFATKLIKLIDEAKSEYLKQEGKNG